MLGENIQTLRKINEMTQEQVAEAIGVSRQAVAKYESGEAQPDLAKCAALAKLFDVTLDELVNYDSKDSSGVPIAPKGKYMFGMVSVGDKGQIVIPAKARKVFDIKPGDKLIVLGDINQGLAMVKADFITEFFSKKK